MSKGRLFDCVLAVNAKKNNLEIVYTENIDDFRYYSFLKTVNSLI